MLERPNLYVVARFLEVLYKSHAPMKKTNIQMLVRLNYPRFAEYLEWLLGHGLVVKYADEGVNNRDGPYSSERYALSPKGIEAYNRFVGWVREMMEDTQI